MILITSEIPTMHLPPEVSSTRSFTSTGSLSVSSSPQPMTSSSSLTTLTSSMTSSVTSSLNRLWLILSLYLAYLCMFADLPRVLSMPVRIYLPKGMAGRILCPVEANPPVTLIVWTRNERVIDFTHSPRLKLSKDGTLLIKAVTATDEGRYTCTPYSPLGAGRSSTVVQIIVRGECTVLFIVFVVW